MILEGHGMKAQHMYLSVSQAIKLDSRHAAQCQMLHAVCMLVYTQKICTKLPHTHFEVTSCTVAAAKEVRVYQLVSSTRDELGSRP